MKSKWFAKGAVMLSAVMMLTACGGGKDSGKTADNNSNASAIEKKYPGDVKNEGTPVKNGVLKVAVVSDTGFKGIFNGTLFQNGLDKSFCGPTMCGAFPGDGENKLIQDADWTPINMHVDPEKKIVTYKINPKFKWSNGDTVSTRDIAKTFEIIANQKYIEAAQSPRYGGQMKLIEGIEEYNQGKADKIKGLEEVSPTEMRIHMKEITPSVYWGGPFVYEFVNAKQLEGVPMEKINECDGIRKNPYSYGPYVIKSIVPGEKVIFEANPYYYRGEAKTKKVEMSILPTSQVVAATKAGKFDIIMSAPNDTFPEMEKLDNIKIATSKALSMSYLGFKEGKWNAQKNEVEYNPNAKMSDANLRKAMAYAVDVDALGKKFSHGLSFRATQVMAPAFAKLQNPEVKGFPYNMDKAKEILDKAGYKDVNGDGIREDKNGKPLKINLAMMSGSDLQEPISKYYMQQWKKAGLDVQLVDGRLLEMHDFYDRVQKDDPKIDCFLAGWNLGSDPDPSAFYGKDQQFNFARYTSPKLQGILDKIGSPEALDDKKRTEYYHEFNKIYYDESPTIPIFNRVEFTPVNKRVKWFDASENAWKTKFDWSNIELTADNPIVSKN